MERLWTRITLNTVGMLALAVFIGSHAFSEDTETRPKIGVIVPLTGILAEYGTAIQNGISLAKKDHPWLSRCDFKFEDSRYDPKEAVLAFRKLKAVDGVSLVYNFGGPTSAAIAPIAEQLKIPTLVWTTDPAVAYDRAFVTRFTNSGDEFAETLMQYLSSRKVHRIAVVHTENQYLNNILEGIRHSLRPDQSLEVIDTFLPQDSDFETSVTKLQGKKFDILGVLLLSGQISQYYRKMKDHNITFATFGTDFFESTTEIDHAAGGMNGAVYSNNEVHRAFRDRYIKTYSNDYQISYAGNGYDFAMYACGAAISEDIQVSLRSSKAHDGILGVSHFTETADGDRYIRFPIVIKSIQDGTYETVDSW